MFRSLLRYTLPVLALVSLSAGPARAANKEHQQMMADIRMLQEQGQRLQQTLAALTEALKTVSAKIDEQNGASRKLFADQKLLIDAIASDLRVVREKADDSNVRLGTLSQDLEALRQATAQNAAASAGGQLAQPSGVVPGTPPGQPPTQPPAQPPTGGEAVGMPPTQLYQTAWGDYMAAQYDLAIQGFGTFLKAYPRSTQAPDAQFYIGESYFLGGKLDQAREAYTKVINNYPASPRVPEAYYKLGLTFERLGDKVHAREAFQTLIDKFPADNQSVIQAKQRLSRLQPPGLEEDEAEREP
ncbi:MAG: tol-pal system protein YbgF [Bacteroidales bacterium]